ncbi:DUF6668 family protein [Streptomyces massasporeus]|uniref:DUF6668 family protein n=1 Tax=Streptomyces massasporeus TaxID=67324 RepID=UPI0037BDC94F
MSIIESPAVVTTHTWTRGPVGAPRLRGASEGHAAQAGTHHQGIGNVSFVAAHGGAGATTLAAFLGGVDVGTRWPDVSRREPETMVLLARTHASGLRAASRVLRALGETDGLQLLALVLMADAPVRLPLQLARRVRVLRSAVRTYSVPWVPAWRTGGQPTKRPKALVELAAVVEQHRISGRAL